MRKVSLLLLAIVLLSGCEDSLKKNIVLSKERGFPSTIDEVCLDNVVYYRYMAGYKGALTPHINPVTLKPMNCK